MKRTDQTATITIGLPASGKTTWAKKEVESAEFKGKTIVRVNNDDIRAELNGDSDVPWTPEFEKKVRAIRFGRMERALKDGFDIIVDNTHLNYKTLNSLKTWLKQNFSHVAIIEKSFLDVSIQECLDRDKARGDRGERCVGPEVIMKMVKDSNLIPEVKPYPIDWELPWCGISDLDGTLALFGKRRNPYDASKCDLIDTPNLSVLNLLTAYHDIYQLTEIDGYPFKLGREKISKIFFFSGRSDQYKEPTIKFLLTKCNFYIIDNPYFELVMREKGDNRSDEIIKKEFFDAHIVGKYNVSFVCDDRNRVVRLWHSLGLPVFNVGTGEEF